MTPTTTKAKPRTARQARAEHGVVDVRLVAIEIPEPVRDGAGGDPPSAPPAPPTGPGRRRWDSPEHQWKRIALWVALVLLAALIGNLVGRSLARVGLAIEAG